MTDILSPPQKRKGQERHFANCVFKLINVIRRSIVLLQQEVLLMCKSKTNQQHLLALKMVWLLYTHRLVLAGFQKL